MTAANSSGTSFWRELKRRKVLRTCSYYLLICLAALLVGDVLFTAIGIDAGDTSRALSIVAVAGLPVVALASWYFQLTPRGVVRTTSFVERRVLRNMSPINDRRHTTAANDAQGAHAREHFEWIVAAETGPLTGLQFGVGKAVELGRSLDCDIAVVNPNVSRRHARLSLDEGRLYVEDLDSANGTVVNGRRIQGKQLLHDGDEVRLYDVVFRVAGSVPPEAG